MKILCIIPPYIPSYFNAGHHLPLFQVGAYLRKNLFGGSVKCLDMAALNYTWKEVCNILAEGYDVIVVMNDFDSIDTFERFVKYVSIFSPSSKTITFGRLSKFIPKFFLRFNFDAIHFSGDYETGILDYIRNLDSQTKLAPGILQVNQKLSSQPGVDLDPQEWVLPDVTEIPYGAYTGMYKNDLNKFCGIPERHELVLPIARGCPINCQFCDVPITQGTSERRISVERTLTYIEDSFAKLPFEYVSFYAPTFTLNKKWVINFCEQISIAKYSVPWKCVTLLNAIDEELLEIMAKSGCFRISFGIETLTDSIHKLPKCKQNSKQLLERILNVSKKNNVEINCFLMLGLPGDTSQDVRNTFEFCHKLGARVRPTIYTPYHLLRDDMAVAEVNTFNRQFFPSTDIAPGTDEKEKYYELFYANPHDTPTKIMQQIKKR